MIKILCLQSWYTISDEEVEFQITDRLSFQKFLSYPKNVPHGLKNLVEATLDLSCIPKFKGGQKSLKRLQ